MPMPRLEGNELKKLQKSVAKTHANAKKSGRPFTEYECPHCKQQIETPQPLMNAVGTKGHWDSMKTCTNCGQFNFVRVWPDGRTEVVNLG